MAPIGMIRGDAILDFPANHLMNWGPQPGVLSGILGRKIWRGRYNANRAVPGSLQET